MKVVVELPVDLKYILCRDWDNVVNKKRLSKIPAKVIIPKYRFFQLLFYAYLNGFDFWEIKKFQYNKHFFVLFYNEYFSV